MLILFADEVVRAAATQQAATSAFLKSLHKSKVSTVYMQTSIHTYITNTYIRDVFQNAKHKYFNSNTTISVMIKFNGPL